MLNWQIGSIKITAIQEINNAGELIQSILPEATDDRIKDLDGLSPQFADDNGNLKAVVQCFLVETPDKTILIDTCNGNGKTRTDMPIWGNLKTNFLEKLEEAGGPPERIDLVINTHLHFDHVGWNTILIGDKWKPTFPNAKYLLVEKEYRYWTSNPKGEIADDLRGIADSVLPVVEAGQAEFVSVDHEISEHIKLVASPGHTPGHVCIEIEDEDKRALIAGDLIYHPCQILNSNWTAESDGNKSMTIKSRRKILNKIAGSETILLAAHVPNPVALTIQKDNERFTINAKL